MRTLLAILLCLTCLVSSVELLSMLRANPPWTLEGHVMALWLMGVSSFSGLGMFALTSIERINGVRRAQTNKKAERRYYAAKSRLHS